MNSFTVNMVGSVLTLLSVSNQHIQTYSVAIIRAEMSLYFDSVCCSVTKICIQQKFEN